MRAILKTEGTKKFIENQIKSMMNGYAKVLKRNPGHISLCEVGIMPSKEKIIEISKYCQEKIEFKLRSDIDMWQEFENSGIQRDRRRLKRKRKRKRKKLLRTLSGF
ncbi:MAG: hypothetical protein ACYCT7_03595 [bacterium]